MKGRPVGLGVAGKEENAAFASTNSEYFIFGFCSHTDNWAFIFKHVSNSLSEIGPIDSHLVNIAITRSHNYEFTPILVVGHAARKENLYFAEGLTFLSTF